MPKIDSSLNGSQFAPLLSPSNVTSGRDSSNVNTSGSEASSSTAVDSIEDTQKAAEAMQEFVSTLNNNTLQFTVDPELNRAIVQVIDSSTGTLIKQIPSEEAIALAKALDQFKGILVQQKV